MFSAPTTMPRLAVVDRGRAVGMLEAGMAARAIARQHNVHATTGETHVRQGERHPVCIGIESVTRLFEIVCEQRNADDHIRGPILTNDNADYSGLTSTRCCVSFFDSIKIRFIRSHAVSQIGRVAHLDWYCSSWQICCTDVTQWLH